MRRLVTLLLFFALVSSASAQDFRVTLLGTGADGHVRANRCREFAEQSRTGFVFAEVKPKLAVYTHFVILSGPTIPEAPLSTRIPRTRTSYDGPLVVGEDLMSFDIGDSISISQAAR